VTGEQARWRNLPNSDANWFSWWIAFVELKASDSGNEEQRQEPCLKGSLTAAKADYRTAPNIVNSYFTGFNATNAGVNRVSGSKRAANAGLFWKFSNEFQTEYSMLARSQAAA